ncbi:MAG TPA: hypothetical protein VE547_10555 [Mycobacteriales bacterium]|jgi:hypothetical protein|nr:hypothetical protein [Mycobacteriales bacterium]
MTSRTEQLVGVLIILLGVVVLVSAVAVSEGTRAWLIASSAVVFLVCGAGLLLDARARAGRGR